MVLLRRMILASGISDGARRGNDFAGFKLICFCFVLLCWSQSGTLKEQR